MYDVITINIKSLFDETKLEEDYTAYLHHINQTAPENVTLSNPYHALNCTLSPINSGFTLLYMPAINELSGWHAKFLANIQIPATDIDGAVLLPWQGTDSEASFTIEKTGIYLMMATMFLEDAKNIVEISFGASPSNVICSGRIECTSACNHVVNINCISNLIFGETIKLYMKTDEVLSVQEQSTRTINYIGESMIGFSMVMSVSETIEFSNVSIPLSKWSKDSSQNRTFVQGISNYKTDFLFNVGGTYELSMNLLFQIDENDQR